MWDSAKATTQLKLLGMFQLRPPPKPKPSGSHSKKREPNFFEEDPNTSPFYPLKDSSGLLSSFLPLPQSLRVSRERDFWGRASHWLFICFPFRSQLHILLYLDQVPSFHPLEQGLAHLQCLEKKVLGHLFPYLGTFLFLLRRAKIELPLPRFKHFWTDFSPFWTQPHYLGFPQGIQVDASKKLDYRSTPPLPAT